MIRIGFDDSMHALYESSDGLWYSVWPAHPVISAAAFVDSGNGSAAFEHELTQAELVFREDSFDPVTRIRRGRFYTRSDDDRPAYTGVLPHPIYRLWGTDQQLSEDGRCQRRLHIFDARQDRPATNVVMIGSDESRWRVLGAERIISAEYLVTLKARHALGVLPELNSEAIPERGRAKATETFEKLIDSAYRETPESIVDMARGATQSCLAAWAVERYDDNSLLREDLGRLIDKLDKKDDNDKRKVSLWAARIIARFHPRRKPNEQTRRSLRPLIEADAEFALAAVGLLLREFGWTR